MKNKKIFLALAASFLLILGMSGMTFAASNMELEERIEALEAANGDGASGVLGQISDRVTLSGAIELDFEYAKAGDESESDLSLGTVELGVEVALHDYVTAFALLKGEGLEDDDNVFWDEVTFTFQSDDFPVYLVAGKRTQPFGVFESMFISDALPQVFEIADTGVTLGYADDELLGLDASFTLFKEGSDAVEAFIINLGVAPMEGLSMSVSYSSIPSDGDRETAFDAAVHFEMASFLFDGEYVTQLDTAADDEAKVWSVSLGYQVIDPLLIAVRYEGYDYLPGEDDEIFKEGNAYAIGVTYTMLETDIFTCSLMGEYSRFEVDTDADEDMDVDVLSAKIALEF